MTSCSRRFQSRSRSTAFAGLGRGRLWKNSRLACQSGRRAVDPLGNLLRADPVQVQDHPLWVFETGQDLRVYRQDDGLSRHATV